MIIFPKSDIEKQKILEKIAGKLVKGRDYTEQEVNKIVQSFDVDDFTLVRRELVNFCYLNKDSYTGIYRLNKVALSKEELDKIDSMQKKLVNAGFY